MKESIGTRIARLRREKNLTQEGLAEGLGISAQAVSKWENDVSCPDIMTLPPLAELLGVTVDELLTGENKSERATFVPEVREVDTDKLMLVIRCDSSDGDRVRVNLPIPLVRVLLESGVSMTSVGGGKLDNFNIDWAQIVGLVERGVIGKLVEVVDSDGDRVEVVVE